MHGGHYLYCLKLSATTGNSAAVKVRTCQLAASTDVSSNMLQALAADTNAQQQTLVRLQRNTVLACNDELKELSAALGHVRLQVLLLCPCRCISRVLATIYSRHFWQYVIACVSHPVIKVLSYGQRRCCGKTLLG